jgi:hypothetical protein
MRAKLSKKQRIAKYQPLPSTNLKEEKVFSF